MKFYFDESGEFAVPQSSKFHRASVVMGIAVSEPAEDELNQKYIEFASRLDDAERTNEEPKGKLLTKEHLKEYCDLLSEIDGVFVTPVTLDLSSLADTHSERFPKRMAEFLVNTVSSFPEESPFRSDMERLAKQFGGLSMNQALRLYAWANCFRETLEHSIMFLSNGIYEESWENVQFFVDPVQTGPNSVEKQVFSTITLGWLCAWFNKNLSLIEEIHTPENRFVKKYCDGNKIDIGKLVQGNIRWLSSSAIPGLQLADIGAYITYRAVMDLDDSKGSLSTFVSLMQSSPYGWPRGPGLFTPLQQDYWIFEGKYFLIREALKTAKEGKKG